MGDNNKMEFKEVPLEEIKHEHPLILIDLQQLHEDYVEDDEDVEDDDLIAFQNFKCECAICGFGIDWYHRYYYKCNEHLSCNYSVHKFCAEMATTLQFLAHPNHILNLKKATSSGEWKCHSCLEIHQHGMFCYVCSTCDYVIDLHCATFVEQNTIHHPGHPHPLTSITIGLILSKCCACGEKHEGRFYHCITCFNFSIHTDCVSLPTKFLLKNDRFSHTHNLTLSYYGSVIPYGFKCRICGKEFSNELWLYKCSKCLYYVHLDCATSRGEPFMSIFSSGLGKREKNFEVGDYPDILNFPLPDESYNILSHQIAREKNYRYCEKVIDQTGYLKHSSHEHPLVLVDTESTSTSRMPLLHNPMKRIKVLCNGCVRPITTMPFYKCNEGGCDFYLHEWCTRLPTELQNHVGHPQHTRLDLFLKHGEFYQPFKCSNCGLECNGFGYACSQCDYRIDVNCGFIPQHITHESHANHLLSRLYTSKTNHAIECDACHDKIADSRIYFRCNDCDFYLDSQCALHLPQTIRHTYDKHSLKLSYTPIENHSSQYFCEVCEEYLDPNNWFYHCSECSQSIHSACAPLMLKSEQGANFGVSFMLKSEKGVNFNDVGGVCPVINMKFGGVIKVNHHEHRLSFVVGTKSDGGCNTCGMELQSYNIFKCLECKFAIHCTKCRVYLSGTAMQSYFRRLKRHNWERRFQTRIAFYPSGLMRPGN